MGPPPAKRFKSSAAPKGTKLANGYVDRVAMRREEEEGKEHRDMVGEDKMDRVNALEQMVESGQMEKDTFKGLKRRILGEGGNSNGTKGLDWEMLRRARRGENIEVENDAGLQVKGDANGREHTPETDMDKGFEDALGVEQGDTGLGAVKKKEVPKKRGVLARKHGRQTRDEILKQFKEKRENTHDSVDDPGQRLGSKFRKVDVTGIASDSNKKKWIEFDEKSGRRREVLMTTDKEGNPKRKVRWLDKEPTMTDSNRKASGLNATSNGKRTLESKVEVLGMEVPAELAERQRKLFANQSSQEEDDEDIFAGVGAAYNPLDDANEDSPDNVTSDEDQYQTQNGGNVNSAKNPSEPSKTTLKPRDYFSTTSDHESKTLQSDVLTHDPTLMAAIKRAATIGKAEDQREQDVVSTDADAARRKQFLEKIKKRDQEDAEDLDMGFGESRFEDDDDEGLVIEDGENDKEGEKTRKRGPKKKRGNKENMSDVMSVIASRTANRSK